MCIELFFDKENKTVLPAFYLKLVSLASTRFVTMPSAFFKLGG